MENAPSPQNNESLGGYLHLAVDIYRLKKKKMTSTVVTLAVRFCNHLTVLYFQCFRYLLELKEKVIMNTEQTGAAKIQEDTDNLKQEFDKLIADLQDVRNKLTNRASQFDDISKVRNTRLIKVLFVIT